MREASRLFTDTRILLEHQEIDHTIDRLRDRAVVAVADKRLRERAFNVVASYIEKHCRLPGSILTRSTPLYEIRRSNYHWVVGLNLAEEQFNACIVQSILHEGFVINVV